MDLVLWIRYLYVDGDDREDFGDNTFIFEGVDEDSGEAVEMEAEGCDILPVHTQTADSLVAHIKKMIKAMNGCRREHITG